jgi:hypothetical protein
VFYKQRPDGGDEDADRVGHADEDPDRHADWHGDGDADVHAHCGRRCVPATAVDRKRGLDQRWE